MARETYTPEILEDGTIDHGVFVHRKSALRVRIVEVDGGTQLRHPETGDLLEDASEKFSWVSEEELFNGGH